MNRWGLRKRWKAPRFLAGLACCLMLACGSESGAKSPRAPQAPDASDAVAETDAGVTADADAAGPEVDAGTSLPEPSTDCTGSELVTTQHYLDTFFKGCKSVSDSVYIDANAVDNLDALSELETIGGDLVIAAGATSPLGARALTSSSRLKSLLPLAKLRQVQNVILRQLPLTDLHGLEQLSWQTVVLDSNPSLESLEGLGQGRSQSNITLTHLPALRSLTGLHSAETYGLTIDDCDALSDLSGMRVDHIGMLSVSNCDQLESSAGLPASIRPSNIKLENNPRLKDAAVLRNSSSANVISLIKLPALRSLRDLHDLVDSFAISIDACDAIEDFTGLSKLQRVNHLNVTNSSGFQTLHGLDALEQIPDALALKGLPALRGLQGLERVNKLGALTLRDLPGVTSLAGLENVNVLNSLAVFGSTALQTLRGLERVQTPGVIQIEGSSTLQSLEGLSMNKLSVLSLTDNVKLASLAGLDALTEISNNLHLESNPMLTSLSGLERLARTRHLKITGNAKLASLRALSALVGENISATIEHNPRLPQCEIERLAAQAHFEPANLVTNGPAGICEP